MIFFCLWLSCDVQIQMQVFSYDLILTPTGQSLSFSYVTALKALPLRSQLLFCILNSGCPNCVLLNPFWFFLTERDTPSITEGSQALCEVLISFLFHGLALKFPIMLSIWPAPPAGGIGRQMCLFRHQFRRRRSKFCFWNKFLTVTHTCEQKWKFGYSSIPIYITHIKPLPHVNFLFSRFLDLIIRFHLKIRRSDCIRSCDKGNIKSIFMRLSRGLNIDCVPTLSSASYALPLVRKRREVLLARADLFVIKWHRITGIIHKFYSLEALITENN